MHYSIEHAINVMRRNGATLDATPYPTYTEFRKEKDYETKIFNLIMDDHAKIDRGRKIMLGFIKFKIINAVDVISTYKIIKKWIKII